jgi:hypothetical protein
MKEGEGIAWNKLTGNITQTQNESHEQEKGSFEPYHLLKQHFLTFLGKSQLYTLLRLYLKVNP